MKNFYNKLVAVLMMVLATVGYSCQDCDHEPYDDTAIKEQIADLYSKLAALESKVNANMQTIADMMAERIAIKNYVKEGDNWVLTLTNGEKLTIYGEYEPEQLPTNLIYVIEVEIDGVMTKVWATMGADGKLTPIMDGSNYIPVVPEEVEMPTIPSLEYKVEDGKIWIKLSNSEQWIETGLTDEALENLLDQAGACGIIAVGFKTIKNEYGEEETVSATFTLADGSTFTVSIDGACIFEFTYWNDLVYSFYLAPGNTYGNNENDRLSLSHKNLVDFIKEVPQGWTIEFGELDRYGDFPITLTAPSAEAIENGTAVANGTIKLIGVFEGGKTAIAKLEVTTTAFKTIAVADGHVSIEPNTGVEEFAYGILPASEFDAAALKTKLETEFLPYGLWTGWNPPYNVSTAYQVIETSVEKIYGQELTPGAEYVLWTVLVKGTKVGYDYEYSLNSEIFTQPFAQVVVDAQATKITFNDITVKINFLGFDKYYGGIMLSNYFNKESKLEEINNAYEWNMTSYLTEYTNDAPTIETSLQNFPCADISGIAFNTSYTMWIIPIEAGKTAYSESDMRIFEWTSANVEEGGTLTVNEVAGTLVQEYESLSVNLENNTAASSIYYKWYETAALPAEDKLAMDVLTTGSTFDPANPTVSSYNLTYNTSYTLVAVPVDGEGKYGSVCKFEHKTKDLTYSETFKLAVEQQTLPAIQAATQAKFKLTTEGTTSTNIKYYYMNLTDADLAKWESEAEIAAVLALGGNSARKTAYLTDGCFSITSLKTDTQYTLYVLAYDNSEYTKVQKYTYTPKNEVTIIAATDAKWEASKPTVTFDEVTFVSGRNYKVTYTVTPASGTKVSGGTYMNSTMNSKTTAFDKLSYMLTSAGIANYYIKDIEVATSNTKTLQAAYVSVYVTWTDADGNYYEPMKVEIPTE